MYILTIILNYIIGFLTLKLIGCKRNIIEIIGLSFPIGLGSSTLAIFLMDIFGIKLTYLSITIAFVFIISILSAILFKKSGFKKFTPQFSCIKKIYPAEWVFILVILALFLISLWRCYYLPITTYDSIHGIDLVAKYAVEEGRIDSRIFSDLHDYLSTQPHYAPFTALSQIIFRLSGHNFGKIWLSFMFLSIILIIYINLRQLVHPILTGFLTLLLICVPEMFAYTFLLQTDYSNAIFVSISIIYAYHFIKEKEFSSFIISSILFGFAVWTRSETIIFSIPTALLILVFIHSQKQFNPYKIIAIFTGISLFFFAIWNLYYLPVVLDYSPVSYFKFGFWDWQRIENLFDGMLKIINDYAYWGYILHFFIFTIIVNLFIFHDKENIFLLIWTGLLFFSFLILLYHLQLSIKSNINNTFRRAIFKFIPVIIFYIGTSKLFRIISDYINKFEKNQLTQTT